MIDPVMRDLDEYLDRQAKQEVDEEAVEGRVGEYLEKTLAEIRNLLPGTWGDVIILVALEWAEESGYEGNVACMTGHQFIEAAGDIGPWPAHVWHTLREHAERELKEEAKSYEPDYDPEDLYPHCWD